MPGRKNIASVTSRSAAKNRGVNMSPRRATSAITTRSAPPNSSRCSRKVRMYSCSRGTSLVKPASTFSPAASHAIARVRSANAASTARRRAKSSFSTREVKGTPGRLRWMRPASGGYSIRGRRRTPNSPISSTPPAASGSAAEIRELRHRHAAPAVAADEQGSFETGHQHDAGGFQADRAGEGRVGRGVHARPARARVLGAEQAAPEPEQQHPVLVERERAEPRTGVRGRQRAPARAAVVGAVDDPRLRRDEEPPRPGRRERVQVEIVLGDGARGPTLPRRPGWRENSRRRPPQSRRARRGTRRRAGGRSSSGA